MPHFLAEAVVINQAVVLDYAQRSAAGIPNEPIKNWLQARVRNMILNDITLLTPFYDQVPADAPGFVQQAATDMQPIFQFEGSPELDNRIQHTKDFIDSLLTTAVDERQGNAAATERTKLAIKLLSKIPRMTFAQAEEQHERWTSTGMKQAANLTKIGCDVVHVFKDGMYWVKYTDINTMKRDGSDLGNCLATGAYWSAVADGTQAVYGLRKPNDQAVIGVRVILTTKNPEIVECKGKQNRPAMPEYVPHIMHLLRILGVTNDNNDLTSAGIFVNNGNYGTFEDVADVVFDQDGVRVMHTRGIYGKNTLIRVGRLAFWGEYRPKDHLLNNIFDYETLPLHQIKKALETFKPTLLALVQDKLSRIGLFVNNGNYGTFEDVADVILDQDGVRVMHMPARKYGPNTLIQVGSHQFWGQYVRSDQLLYDIIDYETLPLHLIKKAVETFKPKLSATVQERLAEIGLVYSDNGLGTVDEVGNTVWNGQNGDRAITVLHNGSGHLYIVYSENGEKTIRVPVDDNEIVSVVPSLERMLEGTGHWGKLIEILNGGKLRFSSSLEKQFVWRAGYIRTPSGYRDIKDISKVVYRNTDIELVEITAKTSNSGKSYFLSSVEEVRLVSEFVILRKKLAMSDSQNLNHNELRGRAAAIQYIVEAEEVKDVNSRLDTGHSGLYKDPADNRYRASLKRFIEIVESNEAYLYDGGLMPSYSLRLLLAYGFHENRTDGVLSDRAQTAIARAFRPKPEATFRFKETGDAGGLKVVGVTPAAFLYVLRGLPKFSEKGDIIQRRMREKLVGALRPGAVYQYLGDLVDPISGPNDVFNHQIISANKAQRDNTMRKWNDQQAAELPEMEQMFEVLNHFRRGTDR